MSLKLNQHFLGSCKQFQRERAYHEGIGNISQQKLVPKPVQVNKQTCWKEYC